MTMNTLHFSLPGTWYICLVRLVYSTGTLFYAKSWGSIVWSWRRKPPKSCTSYVYSKRTHIFFLHIYFYIGHRHVLLSTHPLSLPCSPPKRSRIYDTKNMFFCFCRFFVFAAFSQALPLLASELGVSAQELALEEVIPSSLSRGAVGNGKLDLVMVTVPETATVEVCICVPTKSLLRYHRILMLTSTFLSFSAPCRELFSLP